MYEHLIKLQPNKKPFLFIEKIIKIEVEKSVKALKYLEPDEWFFKCHWEGDPNMPAMLQLEMMSQTASLCLFSKENPPEKLYLTGIKSASFRKKITPKMTTEITAIQISNLKNIYSYKCVVRDFDNKTLISKSYIDLLWPN